MPPRPSGIARIPVLYRRIFDLGVIERDEFDDGGVQLVLVPLRRRAAFEIADVGALVGDDEGALKLAGVPLIDAEIGRELHRAAHARRHVNKGAVGEHSRIERRVEIVRARHDRAEIAAHEVGMISDRFGEGAENDARLGELRLEGRGDRNRIENGVDRHPGLLDAREDLLLDQRDAELGVGAQELRVDLVKRLRRRRRFWRGEIIDVLIVDRRIADARPFRLFHRLPTTKSLKPPFQQPFRLVLLLRNEPDRVLAQALRGEIGLDRADEAIFIRVDVNRAYAIDGLLVGRHK